MIKDRGDEKDKVAKDAAYEAKTRYHAKGKEGTPDCQPETSECVGADETFHEPHQTGASKSDHEARRHDYVKDPMVAKGPIPAV